MTTPATEHGPTAAVEIRATADGPELHATILQEGRAAKTRRELFAPGSVDWPATGIAIRIGHRTREVARAIPTRDGTEIRITAPATPEIHAAYHAGGLREMSVEFNALEEHRTPAGIREIGHALITGAALVKTGDYGRQATAEIRTAAGRRRVWL